MKKFGFSMKAIAACFAVFLLLTTVSAFAALADQPNANGTPTWSDQELAALVKPAIVRIVQVDSGTSTIPAFTFNLGTLTLVPLPKAKPYVIPSNATILGSGFVVNPNGYILTNAHVVSKTSIERSIAGQVVAAVYLKTLSSLTTAQLDKVNSDIEAMSSSTSGQAALGEALAKKALQYIFASSTFNVTQKVTVLNPLSAPATLDQTITNGFPATVVDVNDNFADDEKDVGIIKIDQNNLPAVSLGSSANLAIGQPTYVFGFPGTAQIEATDYLQSNFTDGIVSAIKSSKDGTFNLIQTNAKVSEGSSGGPLLTANGSVAGIVTYESDQGAGSLLSATGDNFASAIPIEIGKAMLAKNNISNDVGSYANAFMSGVTLLQENHCKSAAAQFTAAKSTNNNFNPSSYVDPFITQCQALIASGKSVDSQWDAAIIYFRSLSWQAWVAIGAVILIILALVFFIVRLARRSDKEEEEIAKLEGLVAKQGSTATSTSSSQTTPSQTASSRPQSTTPPQQK